MQLSYNSSDSDRTFLERIFMFAKRNLWLFVLDVLTILFLIIPPYSWQETQLIILLFIFLLVRDIFILRKGYYHLGYFIAKGNNVHIGIIKGSKVHNEMEEWLPDMDIEIKYSLGFPILYITKENTVIFKQYAYGDWSIHKMKEFVDSFYDYKKEQNLWKIYKGQE